MAATMSDKLEERLSQSRRHSEMKRKASLVRGTFVLVTTLTILKGSTSMNTVLAKEPLSIVNTLPDIGERFGCYFTIERHKGHGMASSRFETARLAVPGKNVTSRDQLVVFLRNQLKGISVLHSKERPRFVHLVEESLVEREDYALTQRLKFDYSGRLDGLAEALGRRVKGIAPRRSGSNSEFFDDHVTETKVDVKDATVREILSDAVTLEEYNHIIWSAETTTDNQRLQTVVHYFGPKKTKDDSGTPSHGR
jgi:hypothetical protein